jgi:tRNA 2-thiouridine synthesizing protein E
LGINPCTYLKLNRKKGGTDMPMMDFQGKQIEVDDDGYIINLDDWSKEIAEHLASLDDVTLSPAHWEVIDFLRNYYNQYQIAPMIKILVKEIGKVMGPEKGNTKYLLYELYPGGPAKQACKYAGLPKPTGCV